MRFRTSSLPHLRTHMILSANNRQCLEFLRDITEVSDACGTTTFIWGGTVIDILKGEFLRDHRDIDGFTLNLLDVLADMTELFEKRGYSIRYLDEVDMLQILKPGLHAAFNRLELDGQTAMWRHVGDHGTVYFPADWLDSTPRDFYGVKVHISGVEFEYAIKTNPQLLNPEWKHREKDHAAIEHLSRWVQESSITSEEILQRIWAYTPFWSRKGIAEYAMPMVAWPLRPAHFGPTEASPDALG